MEHFEQVQDGAIKDVFNSIKKHQAMHGKF
jgi:hypothetical protein